VVLNDPGRLISVHLVHTGLIAGWAGLMITYELFVSTFQDPIFNPIWRYSCYVLPQGAKLGLVTLVSGDTLAFGLTSCVWNFEIVSLAHFLLFGIGLSGIYLCSSMPLPWLGLLIYLRYLVFI
jgi:photosystem II CP47 chlorophyll apoprotein